MFGKILNKYPSNKSQSWKHLKHFLAMVKCATVVTVKLINRTVTNLCG